MDETPWDKTTLPLIAHIDDDEANRYAITRSLKKAGFTVIEGATGREAIELADQRPDLIILDVRLPDVSGFDVCRRIKANPATAGIPVLHLSASFTSVDDKAYGLDAGADGYLVRPVEPVELLATVKALLRTRRAEEALRQSEERYRTTAERLGLAVDSAELGTFFCPMPLNEIIWNDTCKRHFWLLPDAEIDFDLFYSIIHPDDRERTRSAVADAIVNHTQYDTEYRTVAPDGRVRWVRAKGRAYYDDAGNPTRFDGITIDVSPQKRIEAEREQALAAERNARTEAERANQLKDEFLATLSHELRTPLNAIVGWSQILRIGTSDAAELAEGLATIERNANVQAQLIEDLLDVSRIISGKLRLDVRHTELTPVVEAAIAALQPAAEAKQIRIVRSIDRDGTAVWADAARVQQILWNLLSNAIKFTPRGGRVEVKLSKDASLVRMIVIDSGKGIAPSFLPYVFDRFRQADPTTTRHDGGLGLGLAIVKQLAELHGGTVQAQSDGAGTGAAFTVTMPALPPTSQGNQAASAATRPDALRFESPCEVNTLKGIDVLIVEDEPDSRTLLARVLRGCGATVGIAASVVEALELLDQRVFAIVVSDIGMPERDGYDLIRTIRRRETGGQIPAIALSAFAREEDRAAAMTAGFQAHITKPTDAAFLVSAIAELCRPPRRDAAG